MFAYLKGKFVILLFDSRLDLNKLNIRKKATQQTPTSIFILIFQSQDSFAYLKGEISIVSKLCPSNESRRNFGKSI